MLYWHKKNKPKVPKLGFGTWMLKGKQCVRSVEIALETGYRHIDTAQIYDNESEVGTAIQNSNVNREEIFLVTKVWMDSLSAKKTISSTELSLKKLKTDYVDLLLIHWPAIRVPLEETLGAMKKLVQSQKTKFVGISNFPVELINKSKQIFPDVLCNQVEYHPFLDQRAVLKAIKKHNMFLTAYSPLARNQVFKNKTVQKIAQSYSKTAGQVTLRWLIEQDDVVAIPKSGKEEHIRSNFDIFDFQLKEPDRLIIGSLNSPSKRLVNPDWAPDWD